MNDEDHAEQMLHDTRQALGFRVDSHVPDDVPTMPWPRKPVDGKSMGGKGGKTGPRLNKAGRITNRAARPGRQGGKKNWYPW